VNIIGIGAIAAVTNINLVLQAMGRGPNNLSRPATSTLNPTWETAPTHKYMSDQGVTGEFATILLGFANGDLPPLPDGVVWGEDGIISASDALAAISSENFAFTSFNEAFTPGEQVEAALSALGLVVVPDPPL
jgi:hypothetical protein